MTKSRPLQHIGIVLPQPPQYSETFFVSKIQGLLESGHGVTLYTALGRDDFRLCKVVCAPKFYKRNYLWQSFAFLKVGFALLPFIRRVRHFIRTERGAQRSWKQSFKNLYLNSHIIQAELDWLHFGFATMALQSEHVAKAIGAKMAVSFRGYDINVYPLKYKQCYHLLWEHVDKVHSISQYLLDKAYALGLSNTTRFQIITPAININTFIPDESKQHQSLQVLTIARLEWIKGLDYTLEALALLKEVGIEFHYTLIGDGREKESLLYSIHQLGLQEQVTLTPQIPHEAIASYLKATDLYIQYSHSEGFCNAVLEAQAMGCLCIVSDGGALPENVLDGQTGWVVPKRDPEALSNTIFKVINLSDEVKSRIVANAQNRVREEFNLELQREQFYNFYK